MRFSYRSMSRVLALFVLPFSLAVSSACGEGGERAEEPAAEAPQAGATGEPASADCPEIDFTGMTRGRITDFPHPVYPCARLGGVGQAGELTSVTLMSTDSPEDVISFYEDALEGWSSESITGVQVLWEGAEPAPGAGDVQRISALRGVESVHIVPGRGAEPLPGGNVTMTFYYPG